MQSNSSNYMLSNEINSSLNWQEQIVKDLMKDVIDDSLRYIESWEKVHGWVPTRKLEESDVFVPNKKMKVD